MRVIDLATAPKNLREFIQTIQRGGEAVSIEDSGQIVARIIPLHTKARQPGSAKGQIALSDDFDASLEDFEGYR